MKQLLARHAALVRKLLRYSAVSVIATTTSLTVLGVLVSTRTLSPGWANLVATAVGTVPSFELNRRWVWGREGRSSFATEIGPFCAITFAGLALSTVAVSLTSAWIDTHGIDGAMRTLLVQFANLAAFGAVWVAQFVILDRILFRSRPALVTAGGPPVVDDGESLGV